MKEQCAYLGSLRSRRRRRRLAGAMMFALRRCGTKSALAAATGSVFHTTRRCQYHGRRFDSGVLDAVDKVAGTVGSRQDKTYKRLCEGNIFNRD